MDDVTAETAETRDDPSLSDNLVDEAYRRSVDQLKRNGDKHGFLASPVDRRNYRAVWGRDGSICAAAAYLSEDETLIECARKTLRTLAEHRADNGQIPSFLLIDPDENVSEVNYGGRGEITSIDSSLWFLIACQSVFRQRREKEFVDDPLFDTYREAIRYLLGIDANSCGLLEIPLAGDWTDILNRSYHILYDEVLWYRALRGAAELARHAGEKRDHDYYAERADLVWHRLNEDFWWDDPETVGRVARKYKLRNTLPEDPGFTYYQSHLTPFSNEWFHRFDAFANVLAAVLGVAPQDRAEAIAREVANRNLEEPFPLRVLDPPIEKCDADAHRLRIEDEPPYEYHNGGCWPLAGGFWVILLDRLGRKGEARQALVKLAKALRCSPENTEPWGFYEYFNGRTGEPMGTRDLSWNGASFIFAYHTSTKNSPPGFVSLGSRQEE